MNMLPKKKKILFVITKSNWGGAQKYVYDLATNLPREQFDVAVALGGSGLLAERLTQSGIRVISLPSLDRNISVTKDFTSFLSLWRLFRTERPDVVHLNSSKVGGVGGLAGRIARVPKIIFTAHAWAFNEDRNIFSRVLIKSLAWTTLLLSHKTIAVSQAIRQTTRRWPLISQKIQVIRNGVQVPEFLPRNKARSFLSTQAHASLPTDAFVIGTIAELHKNKGLTYAIKGFAELAKEDPSLYYCIIGVGEEKEILRKLTEQYGLEERVLFTGFIKDAAQCLPAFDLFLLPSLTEALGFVLLEAGLAGLPVIATNVGGIPEIIKDGETGILVPPKNPRAIAEAIQKIRNSPRAQLMGATLQTHIAEHFSLDHMLKETSIFYTAE